MAFINHFSFMETSRNYFKCNTKVLLLNPCYPYPFHIFVHLVSSRTVPNCLYKCVIYMFYYFSLIGVSTLNMKGTRIHQRSKIACGLGKTFTTMTSSMLCWHFSLSPQARVGQGSHDTGLPSPAVSSFAFWWQTVAMTLKNYIFINL